MYDNTMKSRAHQRKRIGHLRADKILAKDLKTIAPDTPSPSSVNAGLVPTHEDIAARAEALWRGKGCPQGCDEKIWLEAERALKGTANRCPLCGREYETSAMKEFEEEVDETLSEFGTQPGKETTSL